MGTIRNDPDSSSDSMSIVIESIRESMLLKLAVAGVGFIVFAALLQVLVVNPANPGLVGVWAALFPVWGVGIIIAGVGGYLFVWWRQNRTAE